MTLVKQYLEENQLDFTVDKVPLYRKVGDELVQVESYATIRTDTGQHLGTVGKNYHVLQNDQAFAFFEPWIVENHARIESMGELRGGKRIWIQASISGADPIEVVPGDEVLLYVLLANSHDGSMSVSTGFVGERVVCENTLMLALRKGKLLKVRHTRNAGEALEEIRQVIDLANRQFVTTAEQWKALARKGVTEKSLRAYVRRVFNPVIVDGVEKDEVPETGGERVADNIIRLYEEDVYGLQNAGVGGTAWGAYNAINSYLNHERGRTSDTRVDSLWFGQGANLDRRALRVAQQMFG